MRVGIVAKRGSDRAVELAEDVAAVLAGDGVTAVVDESTRAAMAPAGAGTGSTADEDESGAPESGTPSVPTGVPVAELDDCDLVVSIGGDGTFLYAARNAGRAPLLGVNLGEVGFLTAVEPGDAVETVRDVVAERRERGTPRTMAVPRLVAAGQDWTLEPAVNEIVLSGPRRGHGGGIDVAVDVDGDRYTAGHADGVLVATPIGSTAYNVSEGGPLVRPGADALVVTVMAGADTMPPLVTSGDATVRLTARNASAAVAVVDGRTRRSLDLPATVEVGLDADPLAIAEPSIDYFAALEKLD